MDYTPPKPFSLERHKNVYLDIETTGLNIYAEDKPIGISIGVETGPGQAEFRYYPFGHKVGPNLDKQTVYGWLRQELHNKVVIGHNIGSFDLPSLRHDGLNLIGRGNSFRDTMHAAILDNPEARGYTLDNCAKRYLGNEGKIDGLNKEKLANYHPREVGAYAEQDTRLCWMLDPVLHGFLTRRGVLDVYDLECRTIEPVVEMQENGLLFDHAKAKKWIDLATLDLQKAMAEIGETNVNSARQLQTACDRLGIVYPWNWKCPSPDCEEAFPDYKRADQTYTCWKCKKDMLATSPHFGKKFLKHIDHPFVKLVLKAKQLHKLLHTFLIPWVENINPANPILRFQLHQLRDRDEQGSTSGAVSGRFSCSSMGEGGAQPQQIWATANQIEEIGDEYLLRSLFVPENGRRFLSIDASQIEFRLFAHYSENVDLIKAYTDNPETNFHKFVAEHVLKGKLPYKKAKNINFGTLYNMGVAKFAREMNVSTKEAGEMVAIYDEAFPAAKDLRNKCKRAALSGMPTITILGRRFDWPPERKRKAYIALNRLIQGSAADLMKMALIEAYHGGYFSKMRLTVHDEIDGDIVNEEAALALKAKLESPEFHQNMLRVPLLWDAQVSANWSGQ